MAKKTIPISKPKGTDGQGNIKVIGGPVVLDLGDFDDIFGPLETDAKDEGPLDQFWSGLKESFSDRFKTKDVVRNFLRSAAPDGISNLMGFADEAMSATRDIKDSLERTNASDLQYIAKRAQALLPQLKDYTPDGMYNNISQGLENKIDEYDYTIQSQRDQTPIRRAAKDAKDENDIKSSLDNITLSERLNHNRSEQAATGRHLQTRAEESIRDVLRTKRFDFMSRAMGMAVDGVQQINAYNQQVDYNFQRKGLELQFRSFLGIKELVKLNEANLELNARAYTAMIRNTALTDFEKNGQKGLGTMGPNGPMKSQSFGSKVAGKVANRTLSNFLGGYGGEAQGKITGDISQKLSMLTMMLKMSGQGPSMWDNKYKMAGNLAGDLGSDLLLNDIIPMLGREARPGLTNMSDKHLGGKHNQIGYYMDNMPAFLQEFVNNGQNQHGFKGKIRDMISPYVPQFGLQDRTKSANFQTIDQPAQFNQMTQRTITDGITGYLSRLLQEVRMIRTGSDDVAREVFDFTTGTFKAESSAHDALQNKIVPKNAIRAASSTINDALNTMDPDNKMSSDARKALAERMLRDASTNNRFDPDAYIKARGYAKDVTPEVAKELDTFFRGKFEFDDAGSMKDTADNQRLRQEFSQAFLDIRSISRDPIKEIERIINSGHTEPLRAIGIITTVDGFDKINYPRIWELLRSGVTDNNPFGPGGNGDDPNRDDMSGKRGHKDFIGPDYPGAEGAWAKNKIARFRKRYSPEEQAARDALAKQFRAGRKRFDDGSDMLKDLLDSGMPGADKLRDMMDTGLPKFDLPGMPKVPNIMDAIRNGTQGAKDKAKSGIDQFVNKLPGEEKLKSYVPDAMDKLTDLYSAFDPNQPLIKGIDFSMGNLIDVNTKKIIDRPEDITGEVINHLGQTVVTATEAAAGLMAPGGAVVVKIIDKTSGIIDTALGRNRHAANDSTVPEDPNSTEALNDQDWSLGPGEEPVITARDIKKGDYVDAAGKVIDSIKDISGDVFDKAGNLVLSGKEFAEGLWSTRSGRRYKPTKAMSRLLRMGKWAGKYSANTTTSLIFGAAKFLGKAALGVASSAFNFMVDNQNAYLPGEREPVFTRRAVKNGEYYDEKGNVVTNFVNVYSPLHNENGEPIIQPEQYKELKNYDGTKHVLAKNKGIWARAVSRPMRAVRKWYLNKTKQYYKALGRNTLKLGKWLGKKTLGGFAKAGGAMLNKMFDRVEDPNVKAQIDATIMTGQQQTDALGAILQELKDQKPKELRKGSWQAKDKAKSDLPIDPKGDKDDEEKKDGFLKRGLKGLAGMLGFGKDKKKEEDDEGFGLDDVTDISDQAGGWWDRLTGGGDGPPDSRRGGKMKRFMRKIGKFANKIPGAGLIGRGAMWAGTAIAGLLSAPVLIGGAAVAAAGTAAYLGYSRYNSISGEFRELRFAQYGVDTVTDKSFLDDVMDMSLVSFGGDKKKVLELEALLEKFTVKDTATPSFNIAGAGGKDILSIMGIDVEDEATVMVFARWLEKRFKPVYLAWQSGLFKVGQSSISINAVDDKLPDELKADFLETIKFPYTGETPYASLDNPFSSKYPLKPNADTIEKMFAKLTEKYIKDRKAKPEGDKSKEAAKSEADKGKAGEAAAATTAAGGAGVAAKTLLEQEAADAAKKATFAAPGGIVGATAGLATLSGNVTLINQRIGNTLTALQAIRMRAYGMQVMAQADVKAVLALEAEYAKDLTATPFSVDYNGDEEAFFVKAGQIMGFDTAVGSADRPKLLNWIRDRFSPAFRAYFGAAKNAQPAASLANIESKLTATDRVSVGNAILGAVTGSGASIWEQPSIYEIKGDPKELKGLADIDLKFLQTQAEKEVSSSPTQKASDQMAAKANANGGGSFFENVVSGIKDAWTDTKETLSTTWDRAKDATGDAVASAKITVGMGPDFGAGGATGGVIKSTGDVGNVVAGNGGKWESIPMPSASGSAKAAVPTLKAVAAMTGVPFDWLLVIAGIESNFRVTVKADTSTATGWFQFVNDTWDEVYAKYGPRYGCPPDPGRNRAARNDPRINALMGAEYIRENYDRLKKGLGRDNITDTDVYIAHFFGGGGALKFLKSDPNAMAYKIFKKEYSANMPLFFVNSKPSQPRTIADMYKMFQDKLTKFWQTTGKGLREGGATAPGAPEAQTPGSEVAKSEEDLIKERLAADAKDKDGVAAQADPNAATPDKEAKGEGSSGDTTTVAAIANQAAPMPGAPASGGGSPSVSTTSTGTSSGAESVDEQRNAILAQSQSNNARRETEVRQDQASTAAANQYNSKMLAATMEIRDLMRTLVDNQSKAVESGDPQKTAQSGNNSMTTQTIQSRQAAQRPSALTLR